MRCGLLRRPHALRSSSEEYEALAITLYYVSRVWQCVLGSTWLTPLFSILNLVSAADDRVLGERIRFSPVFSPHSTQSRDLARGRGGHLLSAYGWTL